MAKFSDNKKRTAHNPKDLVRYHLQKRRTNKTYLYFLMVVAVFAVGVLNLILHTKSKSQASEVMIENSVAPIYGVNVEESVAPMHGVFPPTKQEVLLQEMMAQEGYVMTEQERLYFGE